MLNLFKKGKRKEQFVLRLARLVKQNVHMRKSETQPVWQGGYCAVLQARNRGVPSPHRNGSDGREQELKGVRCQIFH